MIGAHEAAINTLAGTLFGQQAHLRPADETWESLPADLREPWRDQATAVLARIGVMLESTTEGASDALRGAANSLDKHLMADTLDVMPADDAVTLLRDLRRTTSILARLDSALVRHIYLTAEHGKQVVDGVGEIMVSRPKKRKAWDGPGIAQAVVDVHLEQRAAEGNHDAPPPWDVVEWVLAAVGISYGRVGVLRDLGIDVETVCEERVGQPSVTLPSDD